MQREWSVCRSNGGKSHFGARAVCASLAWLTSRSLDFIWLPKARDEAIDSLEWVDDGALRESKPSASEDLQYRISFDTTDTRSSIELKT